MMHRPRLNFTALAFSLAAHASLLFAWQTPVAPPIEENVVSAILLPPVRAQQEVRPEPPVPPRAPQVRPQRAQTRVAPPSEAAAWSDQAADLPAPLEARPASLSGARSLAAAVPAAASGAAADWSQASAAGMDIHPTVADPASAPNWSQARPAAALAAPPASMPAAAAGDASRPALAASAPPDGRAAATLAPAHPAARPAPPATMPSATAPVGLAAPVSASAAAAAATPAPARLTGGTTGAVLTPRPAGTPVAHTLAAGAEASAAAPDSPAAASLARALPGRPMPVVGAGEGAFGAPDYADDNPEFVYPRLAIRLGLEGTVTLEVEVLADGRPGAIVVKRGSGHDVLDRDARQQMATWRFKPMLRHGRPHASRVLVPITYRLDSKGKP